jgi:uncharacterized protein YggE
MNNQKGSKQKSVEKNLKMKVVFLSIIAIFLISFSSHSQAPVIKVEGLAQVSAIPEIVNVRIPVESQALEYQACVSKLTSTYNQLEAAIEKAGYDKKSLKNSGLSVNERYTYNSQKREKDGYAGSMNIQIELEFSDQAMNDIIEILSSPEFDFGFSLSYKLSEEQQEELSNAALKNAVTDARMKASVMAEAIGKELGKVILMNYNVNSGSPMPIRYDSMMKAESGAVQDVSLNPTEIEISRSVILHYEIAE